MADGKTQKNYKVRIADGRITLSMTKRDADGRWKLASCEYPLYLQEYNEEKGQTEIVKKTRKQTEAFLLELLGYKA